MFECALFTCEVFGNDDSKCGLLSDSLRGDLIDASCKGELK